MPQPVLSDMHITSPLTNFTLLASNEDKDFICKQAQSFLPVEKKNDSYYIWDKSQYNRMFMAPRGSSQESMGSGPTLSNTTYSCDRWATHWDMDQSDASSADECLELEQEAGKFLANQYRILCDYLMNAAVMASSTWTTDYDGVDSGASGSQINRWNKSGSDPLADHVTLNGAVKGLCGKDCNTMIMGYSVYKALLTNSAIRTAIQYTQITGVNNVKAALESYFGCKIFVGGSFYESAAEGATSSISFVINSDDLWAGYIDPNPGRRSYSAWKVFAYTDGGRASDGVITREIDIEEKTTKRYEVETFLDVKITAADAGYFVDGAIG